MKALEFIKSLKGVPAFLQVEPQPSGGCLSQCPSCAPFPSVGLSLAFNQIGEDLVVRCYGGCSDGELVEGLYFPSDGMKVITANQWLARERERGHDADYLQEKLNTDLPLPEALRPPAAHPIPRARTFDELLSLKVAPRVELCGPWLKEGTLTEVYGWRGAGKSWFGLSLAFAVASGVDFMRWGVTEARGVLYVDGEMGLDDIQARIPRIHQSEQKRAGRPLHPKLRYIADSDLELFPNGLPKLSTKEGKALVEANLEGISLVVLDNLSTLYNSAIENDAESWVEAQDWLLSLRRRGLAVVFVHHAGKGGQQRGTSKREDICDTVIALKKPETHQAEDGCAFTLAFEKNRGVHGPSVASFSAKLTEDEHGYLVWALQDVKESKTSQVLALQEEGMGVREIARTLGINPSTVSRYLKGRVLPVAPPIRGGGQQQHTYKPEPATQQATPKATPKELSLIARTSQPTQSNTLGNTLGNTAQCSALPTPSTQATPEATPQATPKNVELKVTQYLLKPRG